MADYVSFFVPAKKAASGLGAVAFTTKKVPTFQQAKVTTLANLKRTGLVNASVADKLDALTTGQLVMIGGAATVVGYFVLKALKR